MFKPTFSYFPSDSLAVFKPTFSYFPSDSLAVLWQFLGFVVVVPSDMCARQPLTSRPTLLQFLGLMVVAPSDMCASQTLRLQATCALVRLSLLVRLFGNYVRRAASGFLECSQKVCPWRFQATCPGLFSKKPLTCCCPRGSDMKPSHIRC